jgi:hypothetical protein
MNGRILYREITEVIAKGMECVAVTRRAVHLHLGHGQVEFVLKLCDPK